MEQESLTPTAAVAQRVKELRTQRRWNAQQLADAMVAVGIKWQRSTVAKLENGYRESVSVAELFALGQVFEVSPTHLLVSEFDTPLQVTPARSEPMHLVRMWIDMGQVPLDDVVDYWDRMNRDDELGNELRRRYFAEQTGQQQLGDGIRLLRQAREAENGR